MARGMGCDVPEKEDGTYAINKGKVSDLISTVVGTRRIDPVVQFMLNAREK